MSDARDKQAEQALDYLRICGDTELGSEFDDDAKSRSLTKDENEVKEAALTCLLDYFVSDPERQMANRPSKSKSKSKSKSNKTKIA